MLRPTHAVIDLSALEENLQFIRSLVPRKGIAAVIKADAYGHGAVPIGKRLEKAGVNALAVATVEEGLELRQAGIQIPILILGGLMGSGEKAILEVLENRLTPVVHTEMVLPILEAEASKRATRLTFHLKLDTGMGRMGLLLKALPSFLAKLKECPHLALEGVLSHLAWREEDGYTNEQIIKFREACSLISKGYPSLVWHLANSAATMAKSPIAFDFPGTYWVRPGIMLYGVPPYLDWRGKENLKPVMSIKSKIALTKRVPAGTKVSYNCTYTTPQETRLALIPIGYADGFPWSASNQAQVLIGGKRFAQVGRVTMDMILVDIGIDSHVLVGDECVLLGSQGSETIRADDVARWAGTISYEILCRISKRMPRVYIS